MCGKHKVESIRERLNKGIREHDILLQERLSFKIKLNLESSDSCNRLEIFVDILKHINHWLRINLCKGCYLACFTDYLVLHEAFHAIYHPVQLPLFSSVSSTLGILITRRSCTLHTVEFKQFLRRFYKIFNLAFFFIENCFLSPHELLDLLLHILGLQKLASQGVIFKEFPSKSRQLPHDFQKFRICFLVLIIDSFLLF